MHEPLTPNAPQRRSHEGLEQAIDLALAAAPVIMIPADFAARTGLLAFGQASRRPAPILSAPRYARAAMVFCTVAVLVALLALMPAVLGRSSPFQVLVFTWLLCVEAVLLAAALGPWRVFGNSPR